MIRSSRPVGRRVLRVAGRAVLAAPLALLLVAATAALPGTEAVAAPTGPTSPAALATHAPYHDPSLPVPTRVDDLLSRMTLDEKLGQMTQAERQGASPAQAQDNVLGSILSGGGSAPSPNTATAWADMYDAYQNAAAETRLGIPVIYGVDAVHGHNNVVGATIFPHNIGLGATRNPTLVQEIGRATAEEVAGTGINWDFAPCLCVARNDRWGRTYESYSEDPDIVSSLTTYVDGLQGTSLDGPASVLATAKHYVGDGGTTGGVDQGNTELSEADLRAIHLPPFEAAVDRGVGSVMISFSSWNGQKAHGHSFLINTLLKGELGFSGFVISDWNGIDQIDGQPGFTAAEVTQAINAGIDMVMVPFDWQNFISTLRAEVEAGRIPMSRIDDANRRILTKKFELGLFEEPLTDRSWTPTVGNAEHRDLARQAVQESQVLLKNDNDVLPLPQTGDRYFVAGHNADDIGNQSGGWTISWQGSSGPTTSGTTILEGIRDAVSPGTTVDFNADGFGIDDSYNAAIAVVGETPYAEGAGDRPGSMSLSGTDLATLSRLQDADVPVIVVLVSGRPLDIASELGDWDALLAAWLPGTEGQGVADVLFGDFNPTGQLPMTWMQSASQQPINDGDGQPALFPLGAGLQFGQPGGAERDAFSTIEAEDFDDQFGIQTEASSEGGENIGWIANGDWARYDGVDFGTGEPASTFEARVASGAAGGATGQVQVRLDSPTAPVAASFSISNTGGWQSWQTVQAGTNGITGVHDVYLTFASGQPADFVNVNWFQFSRGDPATLVFADEFDGPAGSPPDPSKWTHEVNGNGGGNNELQFYTDSTTNAAHDGQGHLVITARRENPANHQCWYGTCEYTSARLNTASTFTQQYGHFEARIQVPRGQGMWPAFWMLGDNIGQVGWPNSGEIDVMENIGREPSTVHGSLHGPGYSGGNPITGTYELPGGGAFADGFHTFAVDWSPEQITWSVDGDAYQTFTPADTNGNAWVFDHPFFLILNVAVGGNFPGPPDDTTQFPQQMVVDYVRVTAS